MATQSNFKHWPTILLGLLVVIILLMVMFTYQLQETQSAVVTTLGRINQELPGPGLHFRWPVPFQKVHKFDRRIRSFQGFEGKIEETATADEKNILVGIFVDYRIADPVKFFTSLENVQNAERQLNDWMRGAKSSAIGRYKFDQIINTDPKVMKLDEIQKEIKEELVKVASPYGLEICSVGINTLNVPSSISEEIFKRMIQTRKRVAQGYLSEGNSQAETIRIEADREKGIILADAEARAKEIRAGGDAEAAKYYAVFKENPELAIFLRKLDSLRIVMKGKTTLVLDTDCAPFDLFKMGADTLKTPAGK